MSDNIPTDLVDRMMVKCACRCCICRRFRPTKLQVHRVVERNLGRSHLSVIDKPVRQAALV